jgi:putative ABC transport system ATP-binding protein
VRLSPKARILTCEAQATSTQTKVIIPTVIVVKNLEKSFVLKTKMGNEFLPILKNLNFRIDAGTWCSLTGPSGSGKSTLLGLLAGLDDPTGGSVLIDGVDLGTLNEDQKSQLRALKMGFVFQSFRLIPSLSALENVRVSAELSGQSDALERAQNWLSRVGLASRMAHFPHQLSGGEQQRVAIARAFASSPKILFADEPTGNLDSKNGERILELLTELHVENKTTLVVVTHDRSVAARGQVQIRLKDGVLDGVGNE